MTICETGDYAAWRRYSGQAVEESGQPGDPQLDVFDRSAERARS